MMDQPKPNEPMLCHEMFEAQALRTPQAIAIRFNESTLTYQELNTRANQLAYHLKQLGVAPNVPVGLCIDRSFDMVVALLGILKAGGAYVPLDPAYPHDRLVYMLQNARAPVLVTQKKLAQYFVAGPHTTVCIDAEWPTVTRCDDNNLMAPITANNLAYVIYTSGSTGKPKGVAMPHEPLVNLIKWQNTQTKTIQGRTLQFTPLSFDVSFQEIFGTLSLGGQLVLINDQKRRDPDYLLQQLIDKKINRLFLPFVALNQLAEAITYTGKVPESLIEVITAGEQLRITPAITSWFSQVPNGTLSNHYGPSESHVVTACTLSGNPSKWPTLPPIGKAITGAAIYILNPQTLEPVAGGATGEIYIGGISLAAGYLHRPDITAERFLMRINTLSGRGPYYKTGDLARRLPDGDIEYLGRTDQQVKIRGVRIEPGEIESALEQHPEVKKAVVIAREDVPGDKRLVAYATGRANQSEQEVLHQLKSQLIDSMVPSALVWLSSFPLTPSGKVDKRALPVPQYKRLVANTTYVAPETATEVVLADVWKGVLNLDQVGVHDSFYDLSGDSLKAVPLMRRVCKAFSLDFPVLALFETQTIYALAQMIDARLDQRQTIAGNSSTCLAANGLSKEQLLADTLLDTAITCTAPPVNTARPPQHILLTGVTGFLGAFLLAELLDTTTADVYCLVRAQDLDSGARRIQHNLQKYQLWHTEYSARIIPVVGNLAMPLLGLSQFTFNQLASTIDSIYHAGADLSMVKPYADLRAANVSGTHNLLCLAAEDTLKPFHFISTLDVFEVHGQAFGNKTIHEDSFAHVETAMALGGYAKSKWVAERLVEAARQMGLPACIYRPGMVTGHSQSGATNTGDMLSRLIKGFVGVEAAPQLDTVFNLIPVDYLSRSIVQLSLSTNSYGKNFHCINPQPVPMQQFLKLLSDFGYTVRTVPQAQWEALLHDHDEQVDDLLHVLTGKAEGSAVSYLEQSSLAAGLSVRCTNVTHGLAKSAIACPTVTSQLLKNYCQFFADVGFLIPA